MRSRPATYLFACATLGLGLVACGGAVSTDFFATDVPTSDAGGGTDSAGGGGGGGEDVSTPPPDPTTTATTTTTTPPPPPPPVDAGRPDASSRDSSVVDSSVVDSSVVDSSVDAGGGAAISCGVGTSCTLSETCCAVYVVTSSTYRFECRAGVAATCPSPATDIHCDSSEDCPSSARICCGDKSATNSYYNELACKSSCNGNDVTFCNPATPAASCGAGRACVASAILKGFFFCD